MTLPASGRLTKVYSRGEPSPIQNPIIDDFARNSALLIVTENLRPCVLSDELRQLARDFREGIRRIVIVSKVTEESIAFASHIESELNGLMVMIGEPEKRLKKVLKQEHAYFVRHRRETDTALLELGNLKPVIAEAHEDAIFAMGAWRKLAA